MEQKPKLAPVVNISVHPTWRNRQLLRKMKTATGSQTSSKTTSSQPPEQDPIVVLFKSIAHALVDLKKEGEEQRSILRALVACVGDLKLLIDALKRP